MSQVYCSNCHKQIQKSAARTVIDGQWWCAPCTYEYDRKAMTYDRKDVVK